MKDSIYLVGIKDNGKPADNGVSCGKKASFGNAVSRPDLVFSGNPPLKLERNGPRSYAIGDFRIHAGAFFAKSRSSSPSRQWLAMANHAEHYTGSRSMLIVTWYRPTARQAKTFLERALRQRTVIVTFSLSGQKRRRQAWGSSMEAWEKQTLLTEAAAAGDADRVQRLLDEGSNVDETGRLGETALMQAAELGHNGVLNVLIACGADLEFKKNGRTALMMAAYTGQTAAVKLLLEAGARIDHETDGGDTALTMAYRGGRPETVLFLLDRCTPLGAYSGTAEDLREWALKELDERTKKQRPRRIEDFSL